LGQQRVLVIDDDAEVLSSVQEGLTRQGYEVRVAECGVDGLRFVREFKPDLVILDILLDGRRCSNALPDGEPLDGFAVLRKLRAKSDVSVLMLSNTSAEPVKVAALELGADDYVTKPYGDAELTARVGAILRRRAAGSDDDSIIETQRLLIDPTSRRVLRDGELLSLTRIEFDLLHALAEHRDQILTRERLIHLVWGYDHVGDERLVDAHIRRVRKKVEPDPSKPVFVLTMHGMGYRLVD